MLRIEALPLNFGIGELGPAVDRPVDQVRADAQRVGVVDRGDQRHELGGLGGEVGGLRTGQVADLDRRHADPRGVGAVGQLALGEDRHDLVVELDLLGIHALQIARRHDLLEHPILGIEHVERGRLGHRPLDHVIRGQRGVLDGDAGIFLALVRQLLERVHAGAGVAERDRVVGMHEGCGKRARGRGRGAQEGRAQHVAPAVAAAAVDYPEGGAGHPCSSLVRLVIDQAASARAALRGQLRLTLSPATTGAAS